MSEAIYTKTVIVFNGDIIIKPTRAEMVKYFKEKHGILVHNWFKRGIPKKHKLNFKFCGYVDSEEWKIFKNNNENFLQK